MTTAARRAARSAFSALRMSRRMTISLRKFQSQRRQSYQLSSPSPRLRGEGRGEGALPQAQTRGEASSPVLSPQAGRGDQRALELLHFLHVDPDGAAARQADLPGRIVGDAEFQHSGLAGFDHIDGFGHYGAFDAAARHRAEKIAVLVDDEVGSNRPRRRAPRLHYGGERNIAPFTPPVLRGLEDVFIAREHVEISGFSLSQRELSQREYRDGRAGGQWLQ